jgi:hypothetical protein
MGEKTTTGERAPLTACPDRLRGALVPVVLLIVLAHMAAGGLATPTSPA